MRLAYPPPGPHLHWITQIFSKLPSHSSCYLRPQFQQSLASNPQGKNAKEAHGPIKQVEELYSLTLPPLLQIQSHSVIFSSVAEWLIWPLPSLCPHRQRTKQNLVKHIAFLLLMYLPIMHLILIIYKPNYTQPDTGWKVGSFLKFTTQQLCLTGYVPIISSG